MMSETEKSLLNEVIRLRNIFIKQRADKIFEDSFNYGISKYEDAIPIAEFQLINEKII
jgi:hypothetical protein